VTTAQEAPDSILQLASPTWTKLAVPFFTMRHRANMGTEWAFPPVVTTDGLNPFLSPTASAKRRAVTAKPKLILARILAAETTPA